MATIRPDDLAERIPGPLEFEDPPNDKETPAEEASEGEGAPKRGFLLDAPEAEVAQWVEKQVSDRSKAMNRRMVWAKACRAWRKGERFVRVTESQDEARLYIAPSTGKEPPTPNKCDQLVRRIVATIMVDPPEADAIPASGDEIDRDAAEFSTRALEHELTRMRFKAKHEDAIDKAFTYASAFEYYCVDPYGARQPVEVLANPNAIAAEPDPRVNPETGQVEGPFVKKYVREDGSLTDTKGEAKQQWVPRINMEVLTAPHVHFHPEYCGGADDADGVTLCYPTTLGDLRGKFEDMEQPWSREVLVELATYHPPKHEDLLPRFMDRSSITDRSRWKDGTPPDDQVCFPFLTYFGQSVTYPMGAYVLSVGKTHVLHRDEWKVVFSDQKGGQWPEALPIPVAQVRNLDDHQDGDPYGTTLTKKLGELDEMRAHQIGAWEEYLDRFNNPREYLPLGSIVQPENMDGDNGPIMFNPEGKPEFESIPPFPPESVNMLQFVSQEMDLEASQVGAGGNSTANITSGYQQRQVIEQSLVGLGPIKRNSDEACVRSWTIVQALMRFFTVPQRMGYVTESGRYKEDEWSAADLGSTKDVKIRRGTSTMMAASAKQALAREDLEISAKAGDPMAYRAYRRQMSSNTDPLVAERDDRIRLRVRQQIHDWEQGPNEETKGAPMPEPPPPMIDEMGQPLPPPVHPMTEAARKIFAPLPIDAEPLNAMVRHEELSQAMAGARFLKHPVEWQTALVEAYEQARQAAGVQTLAEQAQAQQAQAQAQQQAKVQEAGMKQQQKLEQQAQLKQLESEQKAQDDALKLERGNVERAVGGTTRAA